MARVSIPILGQASGKFSDVEFLRLSGVNVIRSSKLKQYKKPSSLSISLRSKLRLFVQGLSGIKWFLKDCFISKKKRWHYLNAFISYNYPYFHEEDSRVLFLDRPADVVICNSALSHEINIIDLELRKSNFYMTLPLSDSAFISSVDIFCVILYNGMMFSAVYPCFAYFENDIRIYFENVSVTIPARQSDFYLIFRSIATGKYYHSIYLGRYVL